MEYFLRSARLGFGRWSADDFELAWGLFGDTEVSKFVGGPFTRERVRSWLDLHISVQREHGVQYWPLFLLDTGGFVGCCGLRPRPEPRSYELGFYIMRDHHRKGFASEAARAVLGYAFGTLEAAEIYAGHNPHNEASRGALLKLGFRYLRDEPFPPTGLEHPLYSIKAG